MNNRFYTHFCELQKYIEERLSKYIVQLKANSRDKGLCELAEAMAYSLEGHAGRVRPVLACLTAEALGHDIGEVIDFGCAVELVHTYSLVHDDLPCMDDDDFRRGKPSTHKKYGQALAVLAGDALSTESYRWLADAYKAKPELALHLIQDLATSVGPQGMVGGQAVDILLREQKVSPLEIEVLHKLKTGAVFRMTVVGAARICGANAQELETLDQFGTHLGFIFQIVDDMGDCDKKGEKGELSFVKTVGLEKSKAVCEQLIAKTHGVLAPLGEGAIALKDLVSYVYERTTPNELLRTN